MNERLAKALDRPAAQPKIAQLDNYACDAVVRAGPPKPGGGRREIDRKIGPPVLRKVGKHFPEHGDELEPVTGQTGGERHLRVFRMPANNEMPVGAQRI